MTDPDPFPDKSLPEEASNAPAEAERADSTPALVENHRVGTELAGRIKDSLPRILAHSQAFEVYDAGEGGRVERPIETTEVPYNPMSYQGFEVFGRQMVPGTRFLRITIEDKTFDLSAQRYGDVEAYQLGHFSWRDGVAYIEVSTLGMPHVCLDTIIPTDEAVKQPIIREISDVVIEMVGKASDLEPALQYTREQVVDGYRKFVEDGIQHPDDLNLRDPEVIAANNALFAWIAQEQEGAKRIGTSEAAIRQQFEATTVEVDAGFADPDYLDEVANDWLVQAEEAARAQGSTELADEIHVKANEINARLSQ